MLNFLIISSFSADLVYDFGFDQSFVQKVKNVEGDVQVPQVVKTIMSNAFADIPNLDDITFEENSALTSILDDAFKNCGSKEITLPAFYTLFQTRSFANSNFEIIIYQCSKISKFSFNCLTETTKIKTISVGDNLLYQGGKLNLSGYDDINFEHRPFAQSIVEQIYISNSFNPIPDEFFYGMSFLTDVEINTTYNTIGSQQFMDTKLKNLIVNGKGVMVDRVLDFTDSGITSIYDWSLAYSPVISIYVPASFTYISRYAFTQLPELKSLVILWNYFSNLQYLPDLDGSGSLDYLLINGAEIIKDRILNLSFNFQATLTSSEFSDRNFIGVLLPSDFQLPQRCFLNCRTLQWISSPGSFYFTQSETFEDCISLSSIIMGDIQVLDLEGTLNFLNSKVNGIPASTFSGVLPIKKIVVSSELRSIGSNAFRGCNNVGKILFASFTAVFSNFAFDDLSNLLEITYITGINPSDFSHLNFRNIFGSSLPGKNWEDFTGTETLFPPLFPSTLQFSATFQFTTSPLFSSTSYLDSSHFSDLSAFFTPEEIKSGNSDSDSVSNNLNDSGGISGGILLVIILGVVLVLGLGAFVIYYLSLKRSSPTNIDIGAEFNTDGAIKL